MAERKFPILMVLPPLIFMVLAVTFYVGMQRDNPNDLPSTFIGKLAPEFPDMSVTGYDAPTAEMITTGQVTLVNFWASWCPPCRAEHPVLLELASQGIPIIGVNFKDDDDKASQYLGRDGNPFSAVGFDPAGRTAIEWGVTGPPETFILDGSGKIVFKFTGPLVGSDYENRFLPTLSQALGS